MKEEEKGGGGVPNRELYAILNISPDASDEEIRKAYRQWAQIYHPDKYQAAQMKDIATENFQRICEAYEILSDEHKRLIYDIYGMEGLTSGLELGPNLNKAEEIKEELERLRRQKEQENVSSHVRPSGSVMANLSLPQFWEGDGIMKGMAMASEVQSQISKQSVIALGGNLAVDGRSGGGVASIVFRHQISPASSIEVMGSAGLRALIGVQTSRQLSQHSSATMGLAVSLKDGSINLSNHWTRQLSETTNGNIQLALGTDTSIGVGWQKKDQKMSAAGDIKIGPGAFGVTAHYTRRFSSNSHGRIAGKFGSGALELEVGGGRKISNFSTIRMLYTVGIQGIFWKFELHRGGQKLIVPAKVYSGFRPFMNPAFFHPALLQSSRGLYFLDVLSSKKPILKKLQIKVLLSRHLNPMFAGGAFIIPTSLYFLIKAYVVKPYILKREKQKALENVEKTLSQVRESRAAADKAQQLLQNVANRKRSRQLETGGLVVTKAIYGNRKALRNRSQSEEVNDEVTSQIIDVTLPLNFLVNETGQLKLHGGVKKSGIMGFCDPCPGESKQLYVEYTYGGNKYEVTVDDYEELIIPKEAHRI